MGELAIPFLAGILTTLSPCVLPVLPFVTASSLSKNRLGPFALSIGLLITFVGTSILLAMTGRILGIDQKALKTIAGFGLLLSGLLFLIPSLAEKFTNLFSHAIQGANQASTKSYGSPLLTEFMSGIFLGIVWAPCSGPSLGTAISLAAQTATASRAVAILSLFGVGAVLPLLGIAYGARGLFSKLKNHSTGLARIKKIFGALMVAFGILVITNFDKPVEAWILSAMPQSWIELITRF